MLLWSSKPGALRTRLRLLRGMWALQVKQRLLELSPDLKIFLDVDECATSVRTLAYD